MFMADRQYCYRMVASASTTAITMTGYAFEHGNSITTVATELLTKSSNMHKDSRVSWCPCCYRTLLAPMVRDFQPRCGPN